MDSVYSITASYAFVDLDAERLPQLQAELRAFGKERGMRGLVLIATEGINATVSGSPQAIGEWKARIEMLAPTIEWKDSGSEREVFSRWSVKIKPEIVALKKDEVRPAGKHRHLSPQEWQSVIENEDVILVDARNTYETAIGKFRDALDPEISTFQEFTDYAKNAKLPKDKKILLYCTGGIRCEKAIFSMEAEGYDNVYQLDGGILAYLAQFPNGKFDGECFVFDRRVSVDQHLQPSQRYQLCPHCGDPGDIDITCQGCGSARKICAACQPKEASATCSKRCRNEMLAGASTVA
jgi:UPF0176 protein